MWFLETFKYFNKLEDYMDKFKERVISHLHGKGFNCYPIPACDEILAWKPFSDHDGRVPMLLAQTEIDGKIISNPLVPFFIAMVNCENRKPSKKQQQAIQKTLRENRYNIVLFAYKGKTKNDIDFKEFTIFNKIQSQTENPSYIG